MPGLPAGRLTLARDDSCGALGRRALPPPPRSQAPGRRLVAGRRNPAAVAGALLSTVVGGPALLIASGVVFLIVGQRVIRPIDETTLQAGTTRRHNRPPLVAVTAAAGLFTGLLANVGGFLLVPIYLLVFGLDMREAGRHQPAGHRRAHVPTLATHGALGHIDWAVAGAFALGAVPASAASGRLPHHVTATTLRQGFGWFLVACGIAFVVYRLIGT